MRPVYKFIAAMALTVGLAACSKQPQRPEDNAIYYWRTTLSLNEAEREFINKHDIRKLYVRYFDVDDVLGEDGAIPIATLQFNDSLPEGVEVVPVVYITPSAISEMKMKEAEYAEKILRRVTAMSKSHGIDFNEIQLDCDWTDKSRTVFYALCSELRQLMGPETTLSSTIRLHQLVQSPPPVDKGVLMVYNTGNIKNLTTKNSIFSMADIEPYLRGGRLAKYNLPLDVAYPAFGWSVVFRKWAGEYEFKCLMRKTDFSEYPNIKPIKKNLYKVSSWTEIENPDYNGIILISGDRIRVERPTADEILGIKAMIEEQLKGKPHTTILYHLDESQLSNYSDNEIDKIYSRD